MSTSGEYSQLQYIIQFIIINYVSEHHLPYIINASHTMPTIRVDKDSKLLKLIGWRLCSCFRWVPYIPGVRAGKKRRRKCCKIFLESDEKLQQKLLFLPVTREGGC